MNSKFKLAHISDLHFSSGAYKRASHQHSIPRLVGVQKLFARQSFDRVVVSGDLSNAGDEESLLRARAWLFSDFEVTANERQGLKLDPERVIVVPGNHDAYNCSVDSTSELNYWQRSLTHYNELFPEHSYSLDRRVRWDWVEKRGSALFIVSTDTTFLGDRELEGKSDFSHIISRISDTARGEFASRQSEALLELFELGRLGKLEHPGREGHIPAELFSESLKIMVAHHYLFDAPGQRIKPHLSMWSKRAVFANLASSDFDVYLCGHKHIPSRHPTTYATQLPRRERSRFLMNVFRRLIGLAGVAHTISDRKGRRLRRAEAMLYALWAKILRIRARDLSEEIPPSTEFEQQLAAALRHTLLAPERFEEEILKVLRRGGLRESEELTRLELEEIGRRLRSSWSTEELKKLELVARRIERFVKALSSRPFLQVVGGSATKEVESAKRVRSLEILEIEADNREFRVLVNHHRWEPGSSTFEKHSEDLFRFRRTRNVGTSSLRIKREPKVEGAST